MLNHVARFTESYYALKLVKYYLWGITYQFIKYLFEVEVSIFRGSKYVHQISDLEHRTKLRKTLEIGL